MSVKIKWSEKRINLDKNVRLLLSGGNIDHLAQDAVMLWIDCLSAIQFHAILYNSMQPVANALNILQAIIYQSVKTGLILKSFAATSVV